MMRALAMAALVACLATGVARAKDAGCGDVNDDGVQDIGDVVATLREAVGAGDLEPIQRAAGDLAPSTLVETWHGLRIVQPQPDGHLDVGDAVAALRVAVGLDRVLGCSPMPVIQSVRPTDPTCADGSSIASISGTGLLPASGPPAVLIADAPARVVRWSDDGTSQRVWFAMPDLELATREEYVTVRLESDDGVAVATNWLRARERCSSFTSAAGISPREGRRDQDTRVTITGSGIDCVPLARLRGRDSGHEIALRDLDPLTGGSLTAIVPATPDAGAEAWDLVVDSWCGSATTERAWTFFRPESPDVTSVEPSAGPAEGGIAVTLRGTNLDVTTAIVIGTQVVDDFSIVSPQEIRIAGIPACTSRGSTVAAAVNARNRTWRDESPVTFTYVGESAPRCDSFEPLSGPSAGGTPFTVHGAALDLVTHVEMAGYTLGWPIEHPDPLSLTLRTYRAWPGLGGQVVLELTDGETIACPGTFTYTSE